MTWRADTRTKVIVFAREPRAGRVKTRLIPLLGEQGAARLHARLVKRAIDTARAAGLGEVELAWARRQRGADLGERMHHAFARGLRRLSPRLFEGIQWGGAQVMAQTRARLAALGWRWRELPEVWDVDRPEDVARLRRLRLP